MPNQLKTNDNKESDMFQNVFLPLPPLDGADHLDLEIYARFMRHFRLVPNDDIDIKILSGIQFTADMVDVSDALVSKTLADMGLRAPRRAFPESYLDHVDYTVQRSGWDSDSPTASSIDMKRFWDDIGETSFMTYRKENAFTQEAQWV